ncbi:MAG: hypothetical protein ACLFUO_01330 [Candidatus Woesearchaeota archaeon]
MDYHIYIFTMYQTHWDMGPAVVSAEDEKSALSVLEKKLQDDFGERWKDGIGFVDRGRIIDSGISSDKEGVIYAISYNYMLQKDFWKNLRK